MYTLDIRCKVLQVSKNFLSIYLNNINFLKFELTLCWRLNKTLIVVASRKYQVKMSLWNILILATNTTTVGWGLMLDGRQGAFFVGCDFQRLEAVGSYWLYSWCDFCCAELMSFMCVVKWTHFLASWPCQSQTAQFFMPYFSLKDAGVIFWHAVTLYWSLCLLCVSEKHFVKAENLSPSCFKICVCNVNIISLGCH